MAVMVYYGGSPLTEPLFLFNKNRQRPDGLRRH
jgi:hypothetical protein